MPKRQIPTFKTQWYSILIVVLDLLRFSAFYLRNFLRGEYLIRNLVLISKVSNIATVL